MSNVKVRWKKNVFNDVYIPILNALSRYLILMGGAGSGKSVLCAQKVIRWLLAPTKERVILIRKVSKTIRASQFQLIKDLIYGYNLGHLFVFREGNMEILCANGNKAISFGLDDPEKIKSVANTTKVWIEEATEILEEDFVHVDTRLRGKLGTTFQLMLSFNPIDEHHWLNSYFFLYPKDDALCLQTTYLNNRFVDAHYKKVLEGIRDVNLRRIYLEGKWGVLKNIIYEPYQVVPAFPETFDEVIYGLDFGYNNPSALIEIGIKDQEYFLREKIYKTGLTNTKLIAEMQRLGIPPNQPIYADCAEPGRIDEIEAAGFLVYPAQKNVGDGIDFCQSQRIYSLAENSNLHKERQAYKWRETKDGQVLDEPVKFMDHLMDAKRYALYTHSKEQTIIGGVQVL